MPEERPGAVSLAELRSWFQELSPPTRREIEAQGEEAARRASGARLLPESHGERMDEQLRVAAATFHRQREPFCLVRLSDSELALLGAGYLPPGTPQDIDWYRFRGGIGSAGLALRPLFIDAITRAELVGLQQNWKPITESSAALLTMLGLSLPRPNGVEVHLPYALLADGSLFRYLAGKRVVLVGSLAPKLMRLWRSEPFLAAYEGWGPVRDVEIVAGVPTSPRDEGGAVKDYAAVLRRLERLEYDVALLSCGVAAKPLAWKIRNTGHTALDVGFVFNALVGDRERTKRPVLRAVEWPR